MNVLICERVLSGHRLEYIKCLSKIKGLNIFVIAPENFGISENQFFMYDDYKNRKSFIHYIKWIKFIKKISLKVNSDVIHFVDGDSIMQFMSMGFTLLLKSKIIITYHHYFCGFVKRILYRMMSRGNHNFIVHTDSIKRSLYQLGIREVYHCDYPVFSADRLKQMNNNACKDFWGLPRDIPIIGIVGTLRKDKNIQIFLKSLNKVKKDFHVLICGKEINIGEKEILSYIDKNKITYKIGFLTTEEYERAIVASDIIFSVYGKDFDGASGPMTDGICLEKLVFSCEHGSLGKIVNENHLGYTVDSDNEDLIIKCTALVLDSVCDFKYDSKAIEYKNKLLPQYFLEKHRVIYNSLAACESREL